MILLGNIRQTHIKNTAITLVKQHPEDFSAKDFSKNKAGVEKHIVAGSKLLRNKIAGYITRYLATHTIE